jgi:hypothetical protein
LTSLTRRIVLLLAAGVLVAGCVHDGDVRTRGDAEATGVSGGSPSQALDTADRSSLEPAGTASPSALSAGATLELQAGGVAGVPADAVAVVLNVTVTNPVAAGFVTVWPCGEARPLASNLNYVAGQSVPNLVVAKLGAGGKVCFYSMVATDLVADVSGFFPVGADYSPIVNPTRILDTRNGTGSPGAGSVGGGAGGDCIFAKADRPLNVAMCDTFDRPAGDPARRSGDLEPVLWGVSRTNTYVDDGHHNAWRAANLEGCGSTQTVAPPNDVRICNGRLFDAIEDNGGQATLAMYPKQPFDIAGGRTGTVVFDVSADSEGPHAAWPEFWWTDQPVPAPHGHMSGQAPYARNSFGFLLTLQSYPCDPGEVGVEHMNVTRNYVSSDLEFTAIDCVKKGSPTGGLNHFEVLINQNHVEVWATDPGSTSLRLIAVAENANITMTRGLIWIEDVHYNASKDGGTQANHTFAWDNVGFDGPTPYRDLSFDVPDANRPLGDGLIELGYEASTAPLALEVHGVYWEQTPTGAIVTFNWFPFDVFVPSVRVNGGPWHDTAWPFDEETFAWRTIAVPIPLSEVHTGTNTIEFRASEFVTISNINLIVIAGSGVPGR